MTPHVILHAGFHKTGTSSAQAYLARHQHLIPGLSVYITKDFKPLNDRAWTYGARPFLPQRLRYRHALLAFMRQLPRHDTVVISCENLTGVPPGFVRPIFGRVDSYVQAGSALLRDMVKALRRHFGSCQITLALSTRDANTWLASNYSQQLTSRRLTEDFDMFSASFSPRFSLADEALALIKAVNPDAAHVYPMEASANLPQGPAAPLLQLIGLTQEQINALPKAKIRNQRRPDNVQAALMEANRTVKGRRALAAAKRSILAR